MIAYVDDIIRAKVRGIPDDLKRRKIAGNFHCLGCGLTFKAEDTFREHLDCTRHAGRTLKAK